MEKQAFDFKKVKKTENEVAELFKNYVSPQRYAEFVKNNQFSIRRISEGNVSEALTLNNSKTGELYIARVQGILKSTSPGGWEKFDCIYKQEKLFIADILTLGGETIPISHEQKDELINNDRLSGFIESPSGLQYYVAIDRELNRMTFGRVDKFNVPQKLHDVVLNAQQRLGLKSGNKIQYERENPKKAGEILLLEAYYDPTLRTIRTNNVLDQNGQPIVRNMTAPSIERDKKPKKQVEKTSALAAVEGEIKSPKKKVRTAKTHTKAM